MGRRAGSLHEPPQTVDPLGWIGAIVEGLFAVEAVAGDGGFGIVYRARHLGLEVPVAIKFLKLPPDLSGDERDRFLARLRREAKLLHRLSRQTSGIVQALHAGEVTSPRGTWAPYLVMEWADGETLETHLATRRRAGKPPLGIAAAARLLNSAASALAAAHEAGVAHLDLKPINLVFARAGASKTLKVLDFGVARTFASSSDITTSTAHTERPAFTPQYGAPEQFSVQYGATGPRTDVFTMALILIEVACGRRVFDGDTPMQLYLEAIREDRRIAWLKRVPQMSRGVEVVLRRALEVSSELRYPTMGELWTALEAALSADGEATTLPVAVDKHSTSSRTFVTLPDVTLGPCPPQRVAPTAPAATERLAATTGQPMSMVVTGPATCAPTAPPVAATVGDAVPRRRRRRLLAALPLAVVVAGAPLIAALRSPARQSAGTEASPTTSTTDLDEQDRRAPADEAQGAPAAPAPSPSPAGSATTEQRAPAPARTVSKSKPPGRSASKRDPPRTPTASVPRPASTPPAPTASPAPAAPPAPTAQPASAPSNRDPFDVDIQ